MTEQVKQLAMAMIPESFKDNHFFALMLFYQGYEIGLPNGNAWVNTHNIIYDDYRGCLGCLCQYPLSSFPAGRGPFQRRAPKENETNALQLQRREMARGKSLQISLIAMRTVIRIILHPIKYLRFLILGTMKFESMSMNDINEHGILYDYFYKNR